MRHPQPLSPSDPQYSPKTEFLKGQILRRRGDVPKPALSPTSRQPATCSSPSAPKIDLMPRPSAARPAAREIPTEPARQSIAHFLRRFQMGERTGDKYLPHSRLTAWLTPSSTNGGSSLAARAQDYEFIAFF